VNPADISHLLLTALELLSLKLVAHHLLGK